MRVDLYLDETGNAGISKNFTIGGIYIVGPSNDDNWNYFNERARTEYKETSPRPKLNLLEQWETEGLCDGKVTLDYLTKGPYIQKYKEDISQLNRRKNRLLDSKKKELQNKENEFKELKDAAAENKKYIREWIWDEVQNNILGESPMHCIQAIQLNDKKDLEDNYRNTVHDIVCYICGQDTDITNYNAYKFITEIANRIIVDPKKEKVFKKLQKMNKDKPEYINFMVQQYKDSHERHLKVLINLIKLFLFVILPALEDKFGDKVTSVNILCGTVLRTTYSLIAEKFENINKWSCPNSNEINLQFIEANMESLKPSIGYNESYSLAGIPDIKFTYLHHVADTLLRYKNNQNKQIVQSLYNYPGMKATTSDLDSFQTAIDYLCKRDYHKALEELKEDIPWNSIIHNQYDNTACSHICKFLAKKIKIS